MTTEASAEHALGTMSMSVLYLAPLCTTTTSRGCDFRSQRYAHPSDTRGWRSYETGVYIGPDQVGYLRWSYVPDVTTYDGSHPDFWEHACVTYSKLIPELRGQGLGKALYEEAGQACGTLGVCLMSDVPAMVSTSAQRVWRSLSENPHYFSKGIWRSKRHGLDYRGNVC